MLCFQKDAEFKVARPYRGEEAFEEEMTDSECDDPGAMSDDSSDEDGEAGGQPAIVEGSDEESDEDYNPPSEQNESTEESDEDMVPLVDDEDVDVDHKKNDHDGDGDGDDDDHDDDVDGSVDHESSDEDKQKESKAKAQHGAKKRKADDRPKGDRKKGRSAKKQRAGNHEQSSEDDLSDAPALLLSDVIPEGYSPCDAPPVLSTKLIGKHIVMKFSYGWSSGMIKTSSKAKNMNYAVQWSDDHEQMRHHLTLARYGTSCSAPEGHGASCLRTKLIGRSQLSLANEVGDVDLSFQLINMHFVDTFKSWIACRQLLSFYPTGYLLSLLAHYQVLAVHYVEFFS